MYNPFHPCQDDPATRDVGKIFKVAGKATRNLDCAAKDTGRYRKLILVGDEIQRGCPAAIPPSAHPAAHRIGIEIVP